MRILFFPALILLSAIARGQSPCENVKLYDQILVKGDQPLLHKLKRFDPKSIPDSILLNVQKEITRYTSAEFFAGLKIRSVKLFDSAVANAWSWLHDPITDMHARPVQFFYAIVFETRTSDGSPFVFRLDFLKTGELLNEKQIWFFKNGKVDILGCDKIKKIVLADTIQPINSIENMAVAYSLNDRTVIWSVNSVADPKTHLQYYKDINAVTGEIIRRASVDLSAPPPPVMKDEN